MIVWCLVIDYFAAVLYFVSTSFISHLDRAGVGVLPVYGCC